MLISLSSTKAIALEILFRRRKTHQQNHGPIVTDFQPKKINKKLGKWVSECFPSINLNDIKKSPTGVTAEEIT